MTTLQMVVIDNVPHIQVLGNETVFFAVGADATDFNKPLPTTIITNINCIKEVITDELAATCLAELVLSPAIASLSKMFSVTPEALLEATASVLSRATPNVEEVGKEQAVQEAGPLP
jgi:hypothetical protein